MGQGRVEKGEMPAENGPGRGKNEGEEDAAARVEGGGRENEGEQSSEPGKEEKDAEEERPVTSELMGRPRTLRREEGD